jgi:hypothetical protein
MKFINYLESITGISIYPLISLLIFITVFVAVVFMTFMQSKASLQEQKNIPLN